MEITSPKEQEKKTCAQQPIYPLRDSYPTYIKNSKATQQQKSDDLKMGKGFEQKFC